MGLLSKENDAFIEFHFWNDTEKPVSIKRSSIIAYYPYSNGTVIIFGDSDYQVKEDYETVQAMVDGKIDLKTVADDIIQINYNDKTKEEIEKLWGNTK